MQKIAIYGKGGIGKSVVATSLSASLAQGGQRVFHVGCDPKHDSAVRLLGTDIEIPTVLDLLRERPMGLGKEDLVTVGRLGIECCEAGGPKPGLGCAGRGVARTLEYLDELEVFEDGAYDAVVFDVLGDVVCGGFAAPLRAGFAQKVLIVTSEEPMALYAANNISRAIEAYASNGVVLAGLVANLKDNGADRDAIEVFAQLLNTQVLAYVPRDEQITRAEKQGQTVVEYAADTETAGVFRQLAADVLALEPTGVSLPTPLDDAEFFRFAKEL